MSASALAKLMPTQSAGSSPGPTVTAIVSMAGGSHSETNSKNASVRPGSRANISEILVRVSSEITCASSCKSSASSSAASRIGTRFFACSRFARAGKTPPYSLCISTCERSAFPSTRNCAVFSSPSTSTIAIAVSSQLVSIARIFIHV